MVEETRPPFVCQHRSLFYYDLFPLFPMVCLTPAQSDLVPHSLGVIRGAANWWCVVKRGEKYSRSFEKGIKPVRLCRPVDLVEQAPGGYKLGTSTLYTVFVLHTVRGVGTALRKNLTREQLSKQDSTSHLTGGRC